MSLFLFLAVGLLAYSNGANDNFKGVSTLFGSGTTDYRRALAWATASTFTGSSLALYLAEGLVEAFKGKGLVPDSIIAEPAFLLAVSLGAGLTVLIATFCGLPISTTHALTGALVGAGLVATGGNIVWSRLGSSFLLPLICGPLLAVLATLMIYPVFRTTRQRLGVSSQSCVCIGTVCEPPAVQADGSMAFASTALSARIGESQECVERYQGRMLGLHAGFTLDILHYLSAGAVGFARGLNDTPKIAALLVGAQAVLPNLGLLLVATVMAIGGIFNAHRVAETMSRKITRMSPGQGFTANLVTSILVTLASQFALPVSTTHVSVGSLVAIGAVNGTAKWKMVLTIILAWVTTLPLGTFLAGMSYLLLKSTA